MRQVQHDLNPAQTLTLTKLGRSIATLPEAAAEKRSRALLAYIELHLARLVPSREQLFLGMALTRPPTQPFVVNLILALTHSFLGDPRAVSWRVEDAGEGKGARYVHPLGQSYTYDPRAPPSAIAEVLTYTPQAPSHTPRPALGGNGFCPRAHLSPLAPRAEGAPWEAAPMAPQFPPAAEGRSLWGSSRHPAPRRRLAGVR